MRYSGIPLILAVALLVCPALADTMPGEAPILIRGPYLTPAPGGIMLHLRIDRPVEVMVEYGDEKTCALMGTCSFLVTSPPATDHRILLTGLSQGTRYRYRVIFGDKSTGELHFLTCPERGPVTFLVMGDSRDQPPEILQEERFGPVADRAAAETGISFLVHTGDFVLDGDRDEDWDRFFRIGGALLANTTLLPVRGNHDGSPERFADLFGLPVNYTFSCGDVQMAVLDSGDDSWQDLPAQALWLDQALAGGPHARFAAIHYPLLSSDERHFGGWENLREALAPVLSRRGIRAVFQGHVHLYERDRAQGIEFVTDARAGAPPYRFGAVTIPGYETGLQDTLGYSRVTVPSADLPAVLEVIRIADLRDGAVVPRASGSLVERVRLPEPGNGTGSLPRSRGVIWDTLSGTALFAREIDLLRGLGESPRPWSLRNPLRTQTG